MTSQVRQNYHEECEALINKQINMEFYASYVYLSMVFLFHVIHPSQSQYISLNKGGHHGLSG